MNEKPALDRDTKDLAKIVGEILGLTSKIGQSIFALGLYSSQIRLGASGPKLSAVKLKEEAHNYAVIADRLQDIADRLIAWDDNRIITKQTAPLVGPDGRIL